VCHSSVTCVPFLSHMSAIPQSYECHSVLSHTCAMPQSYVCHSSVPCLFRHASFICMQYASFKYGLCLIYMYALPPPYVCVPCLLQIWVTPYSYVCHASSICVPCLIHMCAMPHPYVCHASSVCVPCLLQIWVMTHSSVCHDSFIRVPCLIPFKNGRAPPRAQRRLLAQPP